MLKGLQPESGRTFVFPPDVTPQESGAVTPLSEAVTPQESEAGPPQGKRGRDAAVRNEKTGGNYEILY